MHLQILFFGREILFEWVEILFEWVSLQKKANTKNGKSVAKNIGLLLLKTIRAMHLQICISAYTGTCKFSWTFFRQEYQSEELSPFVVVGEFGRGWCKKESYIVLAKKLLHDHNQIAMLVRIFNWSSMIGVCRS